MKSLEFGVGRLEWRGREWSGEASSFSPGRRCSFEKEPLVSCRARRACLSLPRQRLSAKKRLSLLQQEAAGFPSDSVGEPTATCDAPRNTPPPQQTSRECPALPCPSLAAPGFRRCFFLHLVPKKAPGGVGGPASHTRLPVRGPVSLGLGRRISGRRVWQWPFSASPTGFPRQTFRG